MRGILAVARTAFREAVRKRVFLVMLLFVLVLIGGALFAQVGGTPQESARPGEKVSEFESAPLQLVLSWCLRGMTLFGILVALFLGGMSIPEDVEGRRVFTVLTKPLARWQFITGKWLGFAATLMVFLFGLAVISIIGIHALAAISLHEDRQLDEILGPRKQVLPEALAFWDALPGVPVRIKLLPEGVELKDQGALLSEIYRRERKKVQRGEATWTFRDLPRPQQEPRPRLVWQVCLDTAGDESVHAEVTLALATGETPTDPETVAFSLEVRNGDRVELPLPERELPEGASLAVTIRPEGPGARLGVSRQDVMFEDEELALDTRDFVVRNADYCEERDFPWPRVWLRYQSETEALVGKASLMFRDLDPDDYPDWVEMRIHPHLKASGMHYHAPFDLELVEFVPEELREKSKPLSLRMRQDLQHRVDCFVRFPRGILEDYGGFDLDVTPVSTSVGLMLAPDYVCILTRPGSFEVNFLKGTLLVLVKAWVVLGVVVAGSTFLSGPVNLFFGLFFCFCSSIMGFLQEGLEDIQTAKRVARTAEHAHRMQEEVPQVWLRFSEVVVSTVIVTFPDFADFDADREVVYAEYIPWGRAFHGIGAGILYIIGFLVVGALVVVRRQYG